MNLHYHLQQNIYEIRRNFTHRAFFTLLTGVILLGGNIYLYVASAIGLFSDVGLSSIVFFIIGTMGFLASCFSIFMISLAFAVAPQNVKGASGGGSLFSDVLKTRGKGRTKMLALLIFAYLFMWGGGIASIGVYIGGEVKYQNYPEATATIVSSVSSGDYNTYVYRYEVNGVSYEARGNVGHGGEVQPSVGDQVTIKYDPQNPSEVRIGTESKFLLGFGAFLLYCGFVTVFSEIHSRGHMKLQFFLAFIMIGLAACVIVVSLTSYEPHGFVSYFADNFWIHFVLLFANVGILELMNGIIYLGYKDGLKKSEKYLNYQGKD